MTVSPDTDGNDQLILLCEILSSTVIIAALVYKVPQLYAIIVSGSTEAISLPSIVFEWIAYTIMLTYQFAMDYPAHTYAEKAVQVVQDFLLTVVVLGHRDQLELAVLPYFLLYSVCFVTVSMRWLSDFVMVLLITGTAPLLLWSKVVQLYEILSECSAGRLSGLTWLITAYCTSVRILTTVVITKDTVLLVNLVSSQVLNVSIFFCIVYYNGLKTT